MTEQERKDLEVSQKKTIEKHAGEPTREGVMYVPDVDILEDDKNITVYADLPGVKKDRVNIDLHEGTLTLTATVDEPQEKWHPIYREYEIGGYTRRFTLGEQVDKSKISARMDNGVLTLVLPKAEAAKPRKIQIA